MSRPTHKRSASEVPLSSSPALEGVSRPRGDSSTATGSSRPGSSHGGESLPALPPPRLAAAIGSVNVPIDLVTSSPVKSDALRSAHSVGDSQSSGSSFQPSNTSSSQLTAGNVASAYGLASDEHKKEVKKDAWSMEHDHGNKVLKGVGRLDVALGNEGLVRELTDYIGNKIKLQPSSPGYCRLTSMVPSKDRGYVQISVGGLNKAMTLNEALLMLSGNWDAWDRANGSLQASHRCHQPMCTVPAHVCLETAAANNGRKGCLIFMKCPCGRGWLLLCEHRPVCIPLHKLTEPMGQVHGDFTTALGRVVICHYRVTGADGVQKSVMGPPTGLQ